MPKGLSRDYPNKIELTAAIKTACLLSPLLDQLATSGPAVGGETR
jgi:hypothetical protein